MEYMLCLIKMRLKQRSDMEVCQADTELFQAVAMATFVLHGVHMMYA